MKNKSQEFFASFCIANAIFSVLWWTSYPLGEALGWSIAGYYMWKYDQLKK